MAAGCEPESRHAATACVHISVCSVVARTNSVFAAATSGILRKAASRASRYCRNFSRSVGCAFAGSKSRRSHAVPMLFASSTIMARRASNRAAAPEKVKAISRPNKPKTAPSITPLPAFAPSGSRAIQRIPMRRPTSCIPNIPSSMPSTVRTPIDV